MKLLIVEDDLTTIESVKLCFEIFDPGSKLDSTCKGLEAIDLLKADKYDGVIIDLGLPDIDGMDVIEQLRVFSPIPVLVLSARQSPGVVAKAMERGANDYVSKPFDYRELLSKLKSLTKSKK